LLDKANDARKLALATGLLLVRVAEVGALRDGLAVCDLRATGDTVDVVLALHPLYVDVEMQFTHTADDCLLALSVNMHAEGRVLLLEAVECAREVGCLEADRLDAERDDGFGDEHLGLVETLVWGTHKLT